MTIIIATISVCLHIFKFEFQKLNWHYYLGRIVLQHITVNKQWLREASAANIGKSEMCLLQRAHVRAMHFLVSIEIFI